MIAYQTVVELADQPPLEEREPLYTTANYRFCGD